MREAGYYWVKWFDEDRRTVGQYTPLDDDGVKNKYPWQVIGSDNIFREHELTAGPRIERPEERK